MGLLYPDDMISIPFLPSSWRSCISCFVFIRGQTGSSDLCDGLDGHLAYWGFPLPPSIAIYFLHAFFGSFWVSLHFMDILVCVLSSCIRRLCIPFLLFFASGLPLYDLLPCCVLKTAGGVHYGLVYVKISLP